MLRGIKFQHKIRFVFDRRFQSMRKDKRPKLKSKKSGPTASRTDEVKQESR